MRVAFCPERVAQGYALDEIDSLPQIVSAFDDESFDAAAELFGALAPTIVEARAARGGAREADGNSWRYIEFAIANQFYLICERDGVDFHARLQGDPPRLPARRGLQVAGLRGRAVPVQGHHAARRYFDNRFFLGHAAMLVNEGLPDASWPSA